MASEAAALTDLPVKQNGRNGSPVEENIVNPLGAQAEARKKKNIDSGWAWVVLLASFLIHGIIFGSVLGMGLFYSEFLDEFHRGPVATSWLVGTNCALGALLGPVGSILANRFGFRLVIFVGTLTAAAGYILSYFVYDFWTLFFTFGVMTGVGSGLVYSPSFGILALYFDKRGTLATSAATVGIGIGMFLMPPFLRIFISNATWRGASLIIGGLTLNILPCAALFSRHSQTTSVASFAKYADISLFRKMSFLVISVHFFLMAGFNIFLIMTVRFATEFCGISKDDAPVLLSVQGASNIFGRLFAVMVSSNAWTARRNIRFTVFHVLTLGGGLVVILFAYCDTFYGLCACTSGAGFFLGGRWALLPGLQMEIFKSDRFSTSWAYGMFLLGFGSLIMPPFGEWVAAMGGGGRAPFVLAGSCIFLACICTFVLQCCPPSRRNRRLPADAAGKFLQVDLS